MTRKEIPIAEDPIASPTEETTDDRPQRTIWAWAIATMVGVGFWAPGSGTWAAAITTILWFLFAHFLVPSAAQWIVAAAFAWVTIVLGIPASSIVERESFARDPGHVVIDEVAGQIIALIAVPLRWKYLILSFILFRAFDIVKPPPLRRLEKIEGGAGIVLDDVGAGVYALILTHLLIRYVF